MIWIGLLLVGFAAWSLTGLLRRYALTHNLIDVPNFRSSHSVPTPRGGGVAIVLSFFAALTTLLANDLIATDIFLSFVVGGAFVAATGFLDDHGHIPARWRLLAHFFAAAWGLYWLGGLPSIQVLGWDLHLGWYGHILATIYLVWMLNLYNFMDGIDGIASIEAISVCLGGVILFLLGGFGGVLNLLPILMLLMAVSGFLIWNFPPAKIFMGDAGSGFIGFLMGLFSVAAGHVDQSLFWGWVILLAAFVVDTTVTLIRRMFNGQAFYEAHRSHAYQYLSRKWKAHKPVSLAFGLVNLIWLLPIALLVVLGYIEGPVGVVVAYTPLILLALRYKAGEPTPEV